MSICRRKAKLILDHLAPVSIKPKEVAVYDKHTQTDAVAETVPGEDEDEEGFMEQTSVVAEVKVVEEIKHEEPPLEDGELPFGTAFSSLYKCRRISLRRVIFRQILLNLTSFLALFGLL